MVGRFGLSQPEYEKDEQKIAKGVVSKKKGGNVGMEEGVMICNREIMKDKGVDMLCIDHNKGYICVGSGELKTPICSISKDVLVSGENFFSADGSLVIELVNLRDIIYGDSPDTHNLNGYKGLVKNQFNILLKAIGVVL